MRGGLPSAAQSTARSTRASQRLHASSPLTPGTGTCSPSADPTMTMINAQHVRSLMEGVLPSSKKCSYVNRGCGHGGMTTRSIGMVGRRFVRPLFAPCVPTADALKSCVSEMWHPAHVSGGIREIEGIQVVARFLCRERMPLRFRPHVLLAASLWFFGPSGPSGRPIGSSSAPSAFTHSFPRCPGGILPLPTLSPK